MDRGVGRANCCTRLLATRLLAGAVDAAGDAAGDATALGRDASNTEGDGSVLAGTIAVGDVAIGICLGVVRVGDRITGFLGVGALAATVAADLDPGTDGTYPGGTAGIALRGDVVRITVVSICFSSREFPYLHLRAYFSISTLELIIFVSSSCSCARGSMPHLLARRSFLPHRQLTEQVEEHLPYTVHALPGDSCRSSRAFTAEYGNSNE